MDPLAGLKDIQLPNEVSWWPLAIGWWIVLAIFLILILFVFVKYRQHRKLTFIQRQALEKLNTLESTDDIAVLLKSVAMNYFPRESFASYYGESLVRALMTYLPQKKQAEFESLCSPVINSKYMKTPPASLTNDYQQIAKLWITHAIPYKGKDKKGSHYA